MARRHAAILNLSGVLTIGLLMISPMLLTASVAAESGTFFIDDSLVHEVWSSASARHINVTVKVTSCVGDLFGDSTYSYVTVYTNNERMTLRNGKSGTIEDSSATYVGIWETPSYDHNGYAYYGIGGEWSVALVGIGGGEGGGGGGLGPAMIALGAIAVVSAIVIILVTRMMSRKRKATGKAGQFPSMITAQMQREQPQYPPAPAPSPVIHPQAAAVPPPQRRSVPSVQFCSNCGAPLASDGGFCSRCGSAIR